MGGFRGIDFSAELRRRTFDANTGEFLGEETIDLPSDTINTVKHRDRESRAHLRQHAVRRNGADQRIAVSTGSEPQFREPGLRRATRGLPSVLVHKVSGYAGRSRCNVRPLWEGRRRPPTQRPVHRVPDASSADTNDGSFQRGGVQSPVRRTPYPVYLRGVRCSISSSAAGCWC